MCNEIKHIDCFYKSSACVDGHENQCKECRTARQRERYHKYGKKKTEYTCIVCGTVFHSVRNNVKFCSMSCLSKGVNNGRWVDGRQKTSCGYIMVYSPKHPNKTVNNNVLEHRLVMEKYIGRCLDKKEVVHHINGIKDDNIIDNLMLFKTTADHTRYHHDNIGR